MVVPRFNKNGKSWIVGYVYHQTYGILSIKKFIKIKNMRNSTFQTKSLDQTLIRVFKELHYLHYNKKLQIKVCPKLFV